MRKDINELRNKINQKIKDLKGKSTKETINQNGPPVKKQCIQNSEKAHKEINKGQVANKNKTEAQGKEIIMTAEDNRQKVPMGEREGTT